MKDRVGGPYVLVLVATAAAITGLVLGLPASVGGVLIGVPVLCGALYRGLRPGTGGGALATRGRGLDALMMALLGGALVVSGLLFLVSWHWT
ncbi:MAG TPA: DUF3017 domain-containing protein [Thermopolyspora sp.]